MRASTSSEGGTALQAPRAPSEPVQASLAAAEQPQGQERVEAPTGAVTDVTGLACGILMERHRMAPEQARTLLDDIAARHALTPSSLAEALVGLLTPPAPLVLPAQAVVEAPLAWPSFDGAEAWRVLEDLPRLHGSAVDSALGAVTSASEDGDAAAQLIADLTGAQPDRAVIYAVGDEGALHLIGNVGTAEDVAKAWQQVPLVLPIPLCATVREDRELFFKDPAAMEEAFPATKGSRAATVGWASLPIRDGHRVIGAVGLSWDHPVDFDEVTRTRISRAVARTGPTLVRSLHGRDPAPGLLGELMHLIPDPWLVLGPVPGQDEGYVIEAVAPALAGGAAWTGQPLLDVFPMLADSGDLLTDLRQVLASGAPMIRTVSLPRRNGAPWEEQACELRLVRSGLRVVLTWRVLAAGA